MTSYDLAKYDQLDTDMMLLNFRTFNAQAMIDCQSLNRNLWYHLSLLKLEKWCLMIDGILSAKSNLCLPFELVKARNTDDL